MRKQLKIKINNLTLTNNSKEATKDHIFVVSVHNEKYIDGAKANGCENFINSNELKDHFDFSDIKIIGITGTNGKTTTAAAIYSTLLDLGEKVALQGTRGFFINDKRVEEYSLTTPVQLSNFEHIYEAKQNGCKYFVMEVSSHAIDQDRIEGLDFALKILTNITQDHLDYHKSLEEYINIKNSFFMDESVKLINKDENKAKYNAKNGYSYGLENPSTYKVGAYSFQNGTHIMLQKINKTFSFSSDLMGIFNIYNLIAAVAAVDIVSDHSLENICQAIENFAGVEGRMEIVSVEPLVIVDFAHTPDGMKKIYESFNHKDIITVFGAGGDRDRDKRPQMGALAAQFAKHIIVTSDNPRFEDPDQIINDILLGIKDKSNVSVEINRKEAIKKALDLVSPNSVLLILGKGDETTQTIYDKKMPFDDRVVVSHLLPSI